MITGTFYGNNVRIDSHADQETATYVVKAQSEGVWEVVAEYSEKDDYLARYQAIELAQRMARKLP